MIMTTEAKNSTELVVGPVLDEIHSECKLKKLLFCEIPKHIYPSVLVHLIKAIDEISCIEKTCHVLLSGKIYEYFIGRDASAISKLGAYYTNRKITDYIYKKLNPSINEDGTIRSMCDPFAGSGGFTTGYITYLKKNYSINWSTELGKISHFDMEHNVIRSAGLEFFCLTGVLPNMENLFPARNSFRHAFNQKKYDYINTNPPYGGDKNKTKEGIIKMKKIIEHIKKNMVNITDNSIRIKRQQQLKILEAKIKEEKKRTLSNKVSVDTCSKRIKTFAKKYNLSSKDKEGCSLMLIMDMLADRWYSLLYFEMGSFQ